MKRTGVLHPELAAVLAGMGNRDSILLCDAGFRIPVDRERIDLAVAPNVPSLVQVLAAVAAEFEVEDAVAATEMTEQSPDVFAAAVEALKPAELRTVPHAEFGSLYRDAVAFVRTGEYAHYANVLLVSGGH